MRQRAPDIECLIYTIWLTPQDLYQVENDDAGVRPITLAIDASEPLWQAIASRPTLMFSPVPLELNFSQRGYRLFAQHVSKLEEMRILSSFGFPVPRTIMLAPNEKLDEDEWGPLVVIKAAAGRGGRTIRLMKTTDVTRLAASEQKMSGPPLLVQQWIDTGPHINSYRAFTVLDTVGYIYKSTVIAETHVDAGRIDLDGVNVSSNGQPRQSCVACDRDVYDLAQEICKKVIFTPTLGIDIIREHRTNRLFVVELNSGFPTWHLSSRFVQDLEKSSDHFKRADLYSQYNAISSICDSLARAVKRLAC